jgi:hypothetical protein
MKITSIFPMILLTLFIGGFYSCSFEKIGSNLGKGVSGQTDSIGRGLVTGVREELANPATRETISRLLDSIVATVTYTLSVKVKTIEDSLLNHKVLLWADSLVEAVTGNQLRINMEKVQAALIGKTKTDVLEMRDAFQKLLADILSDNTKSKLGKFRDELLGPKTNAAITKIVDSAVSHIVDSALIKISDRLKTDINPQVRNDISFVQKNAIWLLVTIGAIAAAIIFLVWVNRRKYLRMVSILTQQIHDIPDQQIYDQVTSKIKKDSVAAGLEPDLRDILVKNGLIGTGSWKKGAIN